MSSDQLAPAVTELHLHLEGSLRAESAVELARERRLPWGDLSPAELARRFRYPDFHSFLMTVRDMAEVLCSTAAIERCAVELSEDLARVGVVYAEVYVSPYIYERWGLDGAAALAAADRGFSRGESAGGARCAILLDSVRQWGPDAATRVLDIHDETKLSRVRGFGLGGDESVPLRGFIAVYARARSLGLHLVAHAGETGSPSDVRDAIELLGVERVAHGIRAVDDDSLLRLIRDRGIALDLAITSNFKTGAVRGPHPIRRLLDAGIDVTLSTDDPSLFRTDLASEYRIALRLGRLTAMELIRIAENGIRHSFADFEAKTRLFTDLGTRRRALSGEIDPR